MSAQIIKEFYQTVLGFQDTKTIEEISLVSSIKCFEKGNVVLWQGEKQKRILFVLEGIFRGYYIDADGKEVTDCFSAKLGDPVTACSEVKLPSEISIAAVTAGKCIELPIPKLISLSEKYAEIIRVQNQLLWESLKRHRDVKSVRSMEAQKRYQWFLQEYPGLIDIVKHKDIASFIGITPVTLSRIRGKLREKNHEEVI